MTTTASEGSTADRAVAVARLGRAAVRDLFTAGAPSSSDLHLVRSGDTHLLLVVNGSQLFEIDAGTFAAAATATEAGDRDATMRLLAELGVTGPRLVDDQPPAPPPVRALSLAIAQKCNLGCTYCYAQEGSFGDAPKDMSLATALASVDLLLADARPGERANLAFLGGEPLVGRAVLRAATERAATTAAARGVALGLSITTNGTLLTEDDAAFFEAHGFSVTISIDGPRDVHDRLRPFKGGRGSFDVVIARARPLLARQRRMQVSARVTVTPRNLGLRATLDELIDLGFHGVGFSPMLRSPTGREEMEGEHLEQMLAAMVECGLQTESQIVQGRRYPFSNLVTALRELHRGTHRPYPCGAGAGYLGVSADGELSACHRFVGDSRGAMGDITTGVDDDRRAAWLAERHVHRQEPCRSCWARYLCGGGCHHEAIGRGRPACGYIRGWLHYCLQAYARLSSLRPEWFETAGPTP